jgi:hypothetical protein
MTPQTIFGMIVLAQNASRRIVMERFLERQQRRITGVLSGFDRLLFRGTLRSISYRNGMDIFLSSQHVLYKDFGPFAERLSGRLKAHAEELARRPGRPFQYLPCPSVSKEDIARRIIQADGIEAGLICVLSCVEPCKSFTIRREREARRLVLVPAERKCLHLYFYFIDCQFGLMHVRLQTWLPFTIQVCLNGREWLARQMERAGIAYAQADNCFTSIADLPRAQRLFDRLTERRWPRFLNALARRVNPWIAPASGLDLRGYYWSVRQGEYATDVMFKDAQSLGAVYPRLVGHAIQQFGCQDILRFLGRRVVPARFKGQVTSDIQSRPEGVRIKHRVEENSIKMYDKHGRVLRIETTINNPRRFKVRRATTRKGQRVMGWIPMRKGVADMARRVEISRAANERYLEALSVVGEPQPTRQTLDPLSVRITRRGRPYRGLRPIGPKDAELFRVVLSGDFAIQGFRNKDLRERMGLGNPQDPLARRRASGRITRQLRLLRAHGLIRKVSGTRYYRVTQKGHHAMTTALRLREIDVEKLAA